MKYIYFSLHSNLSATLCMEFSDYSVKKRKTKFYSKPPSFRSMVISLPPFPPHMLGNKQCTVR